MQTINSYEFRHGPNDELVQGHKPRILDQVAAQRN